MLIAENKTTKIIGMGDIAFLPGKAEPVPDSLADSQMLRFFADKGHIELRKMDEAEAEEAGAHTKTADALIAEMRALKKREDIVALCQKEGVEAPDSDSVPKLQGKLEAFYRATCGAGQA